MASPVTTHLRMTSTELPSENDLVIILALFPHAVVMSQTCHPQPGEEDDEHDYCHVGVRHGFMLVVEAVCRRDATRTGTVDHATSPSRSPEKCSCRSPFEAATPYLSSASWTDAIDKSLTESTEPHNHCQDVCNHLQSIF